MKTGKELCEDVKVKLEEAVKDIGSAYSDKPDEFKWKDGWLTNYPEAGAPGFPLLMFMFFKLTPSEGPNWPLLTIDTRSNAGDEDSLYYRTAMKVDDDSVEEFIEEHINWVGDHL